MNLICGASAFVRRSSGGSVEVQVQPGGQVRRGLADLDLGLADLPRERVKAREGAGIVTAGCPPAGGGG